MRHNVNKVMEFLSQSKWVRMIMRKKAKEHERTLPLPTSHACGRNSQP